MITKLLKILSIILLAQSLFSCRWPGAIGTTYFAGTGFKIPDGTPTFQKGFSDGCSTVLYARGNDWYHTRYKYQYDTTLIGNTEYRFGHQRGYAFCLQNITSPTSGSFGGPDKFLFPHPHVFDYSPGNINSQGLFGDSGNSPFAMGTGLFGGPAGGIDGSFNVMQKGTGGPLGAGGEGGSLFTTNPLWAGGSSGQFFGWD